MLEKKEIQLEEYVNELQEVKDRLNESERVANKVEIGPKTIRNA